MRGLYKITQPKPRVEVCTSRWDADITKCLEWFASKWMGIDDRYFQIPPDRLNSNTDWSAKLRADLPKDIRDRILNKEMDLFVLLEYQEEW